MVLPLWQNTASFAQLLMVGGPVQDFPPFIFFLAGTILFQASPNQNKTRQMSYKERDDF
jgi:hypothetical protein